jgi:hypothetical protein
MTGSAEITSTEAANASQALLEGHKEYLQTVTPDSKGLIPIEQIRELISSFRLKVPGKGVIKRVAIVETADAMSLEAQNALLKLLEEPPTDSVLILTSEQPQELLATIRSRVQHLHLTSSALPPESESVQLVKRVLAGSAYERLLLIEGPLKAKDTAAAFVTTLATVAEASLEMAARKGNTTDRWQRVLSAAYQAQQALGRNGNTKLVLTELMLVL